MLSLDLFVNGPIIDLFCAPIDDMTPVDHKLHAQP